ncbi:hypothetical protein EDD18DRAFT_1346506 [Armillaria luteobubalina]|uniref:C2H2-type domain-containing protein n=1 Tax=Armillaria luteobubalina TaxID=153913 RepID=A0AA39QFH5_9AGAR|nr:hypothetical protein EDD18DRAFT_1346506 [Armillaria luteobubalina]
MVYDQDSALEKAQLRVYFHLRLSSFKAFLQLVSVKESPPRRFLVDMARRGPPNPPLKFRCDAKRCEWSFKTECDLHRHQLTHLEGAALEERPFVFIADPVAFAQHHTEAHNGPQPTPLPQTSPTPTPASSSLVISQSIIPESITSVPLETLPLTWPTPITQRHPPSFIVRAILPLPESLDLAALHPPYGNDWDVVPDEDLDAQSSDVPTLRDFLWETCGIELIPVQWAHHPIHRHLSALPTSSTESEPTSSGSSSSSLSATVFPPPISESTTSATTLQSLGSLSTPNPTNNTHYGRLQFISRNAVTKWPDSQVLPTP